MNFWRSLRHHPAQCRGHSKDTSPPSDRHSSAQSMKSRNIFLDLPLFSMSLFSYFGPFLCMATFCQLHQTVHGKDPCRLVPGFFLRSSLMSFTVPGLAKSSATVILRTETLPNYSAILPKLESSGVHTSISLPHPGSLLEGRPLELNANSRMSSMEPSTPFRISLAQSG